MTARLRSASFVALLLVSVVGLAGVLEGARLYFGNVARADVIAQIDAGIASGAASAGPAIPTGSGSSALLAVVEVPAPLPLPPPVPVLPDPLAHPLDAASELGQLQHQSWPLAILGALLMLSRAIQTWAPKHKQDTGKLGAAARWLAGGVRATVIAGLIPIALAAFNALAIGGAWTSVALAAFGAAVALFVPAQRTPQGQPLPSAPLPVATVVSGA